MRCVLLALLPALAIAGEAEPLPTRGPELRTLQYAPTTGERPAADTKALAEDVTALKRALERVRSAVAAGHAGDDQARADLRAWSEGAAPPDEQAGEPRMGQRFGERLRLRPGTPPRIDADLEGEPLNEVLVAFAQLLDRAVDQLPGAAGRRPVSLRVRDLPLDETLDRLLGQAGYGWREADGAIIVVDPQRDPPSAADRDRAARAALERAAAGEGPRAAEALFLLAQREQAARRPVEALRRASALVDRFAGDRDPGVRMWAMKGMVAAGDAMVALGQVAEARTVYRAYRMRAVAIRDHGERHRLFPDLATVYLSGAAAARRLGDERADPVAFDEAADELHQFLEFYGDDPALAAAAAEARLTLGSLLVRAGRWQEAEVQLTRHAAAAGKAGHQIHLWLADCAYHQGRFDQAAVIYDGLVRSYRAGQAELPTSAYAGALERYGLCLVSRDEPRSVEGLLAFLRHRREFRSIPPSAEALVATARCYAEIERDDQAVASLWEMLKGDGIPDAAAGRIEVDRLVGDLIGRAREYPGPVRAKVLFYMGQASWRMAERDRSKRAAAATDAAGFYQRVIDENPPMELAQAARLGLARAALAAGQEERAVGLLKQILRDPAVSERDRQFCAQLLGGHYREKGLLREAIQAYRGEVSE
jgi:tetratricopeptide (TPR) repeat protein